MSLDLSMLDGLNTMTVEPEQPVEAVAPVEDSVAIARPVEPPVSIDSAALGRRMYDALRASDMRYEGAHLLAEYIVQAGKMFEAAAQVKTENADLLEKLDVQRQALIALAGATPRMISAAEERLAEAVQENVNRIDLAAAKQIEALSGLLESILQSQRQLEASRNALDLQESRVRKEEAALSVKKQEFNSMSLWTRLRSRA